MNTNFFVDCRWYTTPCKTVLNADEFVVEFVTGKHSIVAKVSNKCYFLSIDDTTLSNIKCDFYFERNYNKPKEFLSNLYETFQNFLNTSIPFAERHFSHSTDDVIRRILELQEMKKEQLENVNENDYAKLEKELIEPEDKHIDDIKKFKEKADLNSSYEDATETKQETATDTETAEAEETTDPEIGEFVYDVRIHNDYGWDTFTVRADGLESAEYKAVRRMELETDDEEYSSIDVIRIYKENSEEKSELNTKYGILADDQFHRLTRTLHKSLFKAIGLEETRKIAFIISNNKVFFNYNGIQYKYYPSQCKILKKCGKKYQRINWKDFADDNSPSDQKQALGRPPPLLLI